MNSREQILQRLREAQRPFAEARPPAERLPVSPMTGEERGQLLARFIREAEALTCRIERVPDSAAAVKAVVDALKGLEKVLAWDLAQIPCSGLAEGLRDAGIEIAEPDDDEAAAGLTGAQAALAASGSLVLVSGRGRPRTAALLPRTHIALITQDQILPHMEAWVATQRQMGEFQTPANINIVSGPSRTADIAMEQILGMHGPGVVHIIIIEK